jgi:hypothetical protein
VVEPLAVEQVAQADHLDKVELVLTLPRQQAATRFLMAQVAAAAVQAVALTLTAVMVKVA